MNSQQVRKWVVRGGIVAILPTVIAIAAVTYEADETYLGFTGAQVLNQETIASGNAESYIPWFDTEGWIGDLIAAPVTTSGNVVLASPDWRAADVMADAVALDSGHWDTGRFIVTRRTDNGNVIPFRFNSLNNGYKDDLGNDDEELLEFLRGNRADEGGTIDRERDSILGDFIHSTPVYVGAPDFGYAFDDYLAFATANQSRAGRIYIGGNDGMLHAFNAATGAETFAYIPSTLSSKLIELGEDPYAHKYYVDGPLTVADVRYSGNWHTVLVGTLGHGGKGVFALDVTSAATITSEGSGNGGAGNKPLWELDAADTGASNLGYTHGKVAVGRMHNDKWVAVIPNGYGSNSGNASLLFVDISNGAILREIVVSDSDGNGMSSPALVDVDRDNLVDYAYAGDLNGNLWKFDLESTSASGWTVAYGGDALFEAEANLSITTAPEVGFHPTEGLMVYVATGRLLNVADTTDATDNVVYGVWDKPWASSDTPLTYDDISGNMRTQSFTTVTHYGTGDEVRVLSNNAANWEGHIGWRVPLGSTYETTTGWRVLTPITLRSGRLHVMATSPVDQIGKNWYLQFDAVDGGAPRSTIVDVDENGSLNVLDNVDGNGDTVVADTAEDRVVGVRQSIGLASAPTFSAINYANDAVLFNHLAQHEQVYLPPGGSDSDDPGLLGGHFDVDDASQTYDWDFGQRDTHTHEYDDKYDVTDIDMFDVIGGHRSIDDTDGEPGSATSTPFLINLVNAHLSWAGTLEINGIGTPVQDYRAFMKRVFTNTLQDGEMVPLYTLDDPTPAQYDAGVRKLTSLQIRFPTTAILGHGLIGMTPTCSRRNYEGIGGEYRNGALTVQILDATDALDEDYAYDEASETYYKPSGGSHRVHRLGYAVPYDLGNHEEGDGMMYEIFTYWHWPGGCYSPDREDEYAEEYEDILGDPWVQQFDEDILADPPEDEEEEGEGGAESDAEEFHEVSTTLISASDRVGRLFWREIVPEE